MWMAHNLIPPSILLRAKACTFNHIVLKCCVDLENHVNLNFVRSHLLLTCNLRILKCAICVFWNLQSAICDSKLSRLRGFDLYDRAQDAWSYILPALNSNNNLVNCHSVIKILKKIPFKNDVFVFRFLKKPSMSRNIRLCTHRCASFWSTEPRISIHLRPVLVLSSVCCSTSVAWSSRTACKSHNSMRSTRAIGMLIF